MTNAQRTDYASAAIVGKPINGLWSYKYAGLNEEGRAQFYDEKGEKVLKGMNNVEGLEYSGTTMPLVQGDVIRAVSWKLWKRDSFTEHDGWTGFCLPGGNTKYV